ncbi:hypothetical protein [Kocuria palustris]|uniref:hypothetical protein n=1 Tax=Kocuria palustris TaxID=71999 RepID=UPI0011A288A3|nr:hypothetical protein [Kocuria palustris]
MRWDELFADMEAQLAAARFRDVEREAAELTRAETAEALLQDRFAGCQGARVRIGLRGGSSARGEVVAAGMGWAMLQDGAVELVVPMESLLWVEGLDRRRSAPEQRSRLALGHAVRALARARAAVRIVLVDGVPGASLDGTIDRAGRDHLDLAMHPDDEFRRRRAVRAVRTIPYSGIACLVSMTSGSGSA